MSAPLPGPAPESGRAAGIVHTVLKALGLLALIAAVSAVSAYYVFQWQIQQQEVATATKVAELRAELKQRQDQTDEKLKQVEKAAHEAGLLLAQSGSSTTLDAKLKEIDTLRLELKKAQEETDARFKAMEKSVAEEVARQGKETAQALSLELRWKSLLVKAQGEVLLTQVHWAEGNRGLAKDELAIAARTLQQAHETAPEAVKPGLKGALDLVEQARSALILEQSSARDALNLLWHRVTDLLAAQQTR